MNIRAVPANTERRNYPIDINDRYRYNVEKDNNVTSAVYHYQLFRKNLTCYRYNNKYVP